jgi:hypothetical protein
VGILGHASALISIKEYVINVKRSGDKRLGVSVGYLHVLVISGINGFDSEKALIKRSEFNVDLDLVVLKCDKGKCKSWVAAEPELKRDVKCGLRESTAGCAYSLGNTVGTTSRGDISEVGVSQVSKLSSLTDHLVVSGLLLTGKSKLVPDVHPVTVLAIDTLTTDLNLNHRDELLTGVVKPSSKAIIIATSIILADLRECNL